MISFCEKITPSFLSLWNKISVKSHLDLDFAKISWLPFSQKFLLVKISTLVVVQSLLLGQIFAETITSAFSAESCFAQN